MSSYGQIISSNAVNKGMNQHHISGVPWVSTCLPVSSVMDDAFLLL